MTGFKEEISDISELWWSMVAEAGGISPHKTQGVGAISPHYWSQWHSVTEASLSHHNIQHDWAGKTVILFPDILYRQSAVPLILIIISFDCDLVCACVYKYDYFDQRQLTQTYWRWQRILMWILHNHCALSPFDTCQKSLCWKILSLSKSCIPTKLWKFTN